MNRNNKLSRSHFVFITAHLLFQFIFVIAMCVCSAQTLPETQVKMVLDTLHGVEVRDPYRWLENWEDPEVQEWSTEQNALARNYLDNLPAIDDIRMDVTKILSNQSISYKHLTAAAGKIFSVKYQPPLDQPLLVVLKSADTPETEHVILDLNKFDEKGRTAIDWYVPSPDGELVAVSLSKDGSEKGDLHLFEVQSGKRVDVVIAGVNNGTGGGDVAWLPDASGFYYTRYPRPGERPKDELLFYLQIWFHKLGTASDDDRYELGKNFPRIAEVRLATDHNSGRVVALIRYGDSSRFMHFVREQGEGWRQITEYDDKIVEAHFGSNNNLFMISRKEAPKGKILRLSLDAESIEEADVIISEGEDSIDSDYWDGQKTLVTENLLYVQYQLGGPSEIRVFDHDGNKKPGPPIPPLSSIDALVLYKGDEILYKNSSYLQPAAWFHFDPVTNKSHKTKLLETTNVDFTNFEVVREFATSKDGTRIPVNILRPVDITLNGKNPVLMNGYGGYNLSLQPWFRPINHIWLAQGGVFAVANIRGGGEYGEDWHRAGMLTEKQNCFDDFAAVMQFMIDAGYTSPESLSITGASNGGLLMGAIITQHPDLCRAVVAQVGIYDQIRTELSPNGAFNIPEFGTVKVPEQFRAMFAYSPYHNVKSGSRYPSILFMTGANDSRVDPMHSRKFTAQLQAANTSDNPIILRTSATTGHGGGTPLSATIEEYVDQYAFLFHELGVKYRRGPDY